MDAASASPTSVFITDGSTGLGLELTRQLVAAGYSVTAVVETVDQAKVLREAGGIPAYPGLLRAGEIRSALKATDSKLVVHLAPQRANHVPFVRARWNETVQLLEEGTPAVVQAAEEAGAEFLVMVSYAFVYGDAHGGAVDEETRPQRAQDPLVRAALRAEEVALQSQVPACVLRAGYVYGAGSEASVRFRDAVVSGRGVILGDEHSYASWIHLEDLASAIVQALKVRPAGAVFNVVDDRPASTVEVARYLAETMHVTPPSGPGLFGQFGTPKTQTILLRASAKASNQRAKEALGWAPRYPTYREGIDRTLLVLRAEEPVV